MNTKGTFIISFTSAEAYLFFEVHQPGLDALDALWRVDAAYGHLGAGDYKVSMP